MRSLMHRVMICLLAIAFVASGAVWRHCVAAVPAAANAAAAHHDHDTASHHGHGAHDQHASHNQAPAQPDQPIADDHICGKCCGVCTFVGAPPPDMTAMAAGVAAVLFSLARNCCSGATVRVDPGIPKRIV